MHDVPVRSTCHNMAEQEEEVGGGHSYAGQSCRLSEIRSPSEHLICVVPRLQVDKDVRVLKNVAESRIALAWLCLELWLSRRWRDEGGLSGRRLHPRVPRPPVTSSYCSEA